MVKVQSQTVETEVVISPGIFFLSAVTVVEEQILTVVLDQTNRVQPEPHTDVVDEVVNIFVTSEDQEFLFRFDENEDVPEFHLTDEEDYSIIEVVVSTTPQPRSYKHY